VCVLPDFIRSSFLPPFLSLVILLLFVGAHSTLDADVEVDVVDSFGESQQGRREIEKQDVDPEQYIHQTFSFWFSANRNGSFLSPRHSALLCSALPSGWRLSPPGLLG
jgi:hypothetical protein